MEMLSRTLQQTKNGQLTLTFPKEFAKLYEITKGTEIFFKPISREAVLSGEIDLEHGLFISWEPKR